MSKPISLSQQHCRLSNKETTSHRLHPPPYGRFLGSVVRYPRYLDTYRRYLRDDTSID